MLPVLFTLGPITVYTFGFFLGIGAFFAAFIIWRRLKELGIKEERIIDGVIFCQFFGLFFSRLFFVVKNFSEFGLNLGHWIFLGRFPGISFWGWLLGMILGLVLFSRRQKWDFWRIADEVTFGVLPFLFLFQLGAFFDGSGAGKPTGMPWGIFFPGSLVRQHPVSLMMAILLLLIWFFLLRIERQWRTWKWYKSQKPGFISLSFLGLFSLVNLPLAFLKENRLYFFLIEIVLSLLGLFLAIILIWLKRK